MIGTAQQHYDALLAEHYSWMFGDFEAKVAAEAARLDELLSRTPLASASPPWRVVDLGAGSGFQSLAMARRGHAVTAIDTSGRLLAELAERPGGASVARVEGDLRDVARFVSPSVDLALCMGDTLTHLPERGDVDHLFSAVRHVLRPGGAFVLTFRELAQPLSGLDRFIPVRSDPDRILTCFLEYEPEHVSVHDIVYVRGPTGWEMRKSAYRKLRLTLAAVEAAASAAGLEIHRAERGAGGLASLVALAP